jgi:hypothetical protein
LSSKYINLSYFNLKGKKEIMICTNGSEKERFTSMVGLTASNAILPVFIILKDKKPTKAMEK